MPPPPGVSFLCAFCDPQAVTFLNTLQSSACDQEVPMPHYCGITSDLAARKAQHQQDHYYLRNWIVANNGQAFATRRDAQGVGSSAVR